MKLGNMITSLVVGTTLLTASCINEEKKQQQQLLNQKQISHLIDSLPRNQLLQILKASHGMLDCYKHQIDQKPNTDTIVINMNRVKNGPLGKLKLFPKGTKDFPKTLGRLLGNEYPSELFYNYNPELRDILNNTKSLDRISYDRITTENIKIPAVYPELADFFVPSLQDFIAQHPECKESIGNNKEVIIITRNKEGANVIGYYRDGYIMLCDYGAFGTGEIKKEWNPKKGKYERVDTHTPEGVFYTNLNANLKRTGENKDGTTYTYYDPKDKADSTTVSNRYKAAMQYGEPLAKDRIQTGMYIHTRKTIVGINNKNEGSHGCVGGDGGIAQTLYDFIGENVVMLFSFNLYDKKKQSK